MTRSSMLNLGCGGRYHSSWTNVDFLARQGKVIGHNLLQGIPFEDERFDAVYHSHLLEHFPKSYAPVFIKECFRVLRRGGIIRIAVPDLERLAREYLRSLDAAAAGRMDEELNYDWMMIHLYDQTVREKPGGDMGEWLRREPVPNEEYVLRWIGVEGQKIIEQAKRRRQEVPKLSRSRDWRRRFYEWRSSFSAGRSCREWLLKVLLGREYHALQVGRIRRGGGIHMWMYDRFSLSRLLLGTGFQDPVSLSPTQSQIPGWADYHLDTEPDGRVFHPDSIFMEAVKR